MDYKKNASAQGLGRAIYTLTGVLVYIFVARVLGPQALGSYVYAVTAITVATAFSDLSTTAILGRDLVQSGPQRHEFVANYVAMRMVLAGIIGCCLAAYSLFFAPQEIRQTLIIASILLPLIAARFFDPIFQIENRPWFAFYLAIISSLIWMASSYAGAINHSMPLFWIMMAHVASGAVYGIIGLAMTYYLIKPRLRHLQWRTIKKIWSTAAPLAIASIFSTLSTRADVFLLANLREAADVGLYNAAFRFLDLGMAIIITLMGPILPIFTKMEEADRQGLIRTFQSITAFIATWCLLLAILAPVISPFVIQIFYGKAYSTASEILDLLAWRFFLAFINILFLSLLIALRTVKFVSWSAALALLVNVGLNFVLIPKLGGIGAGLSGIASEASQVFIEVIVLLHIGGRPYFSPRLWIALLLATGAAVSIMRWPATEIYYKGWLLSTEWMLPLGAAAVFLFVVRFIGKFSGTPSGMLMIRKPETG